MLSLPLEIRCHVVSYLNDEDRFNTLCSCHDLKKSVREQYRAEIIREIRAHKNETPIKENSTLVEQKEIVQKVQDTILSGSFFPFNTKFFPEINRLREILDRVDFQKRNEALMKMGESYLKQGKILPGVSCFKKLPFLCKDSFFQKVAKSLKIDVMIEAAYELKKNSVIIRSIKEPIFIRSLYPFSRLLASIGYSYLEEKKIEEAIYLVPKISDLSVKNSYCEKLVDGLFFTPYKAFDVAIQAPSLELQFKLVTKIASSFCLLGQFQGICWIFSNLSDEFQEEMSSYFPCDKDRFSLFLKFLIRSLILDDCVSAARFIVENSPAQEEFSRIIRFFQSNSRLT